MSWTVSKPIVVPFDFSDHALEAVRKAVLIAEDPNQIHVLHVLPFLIPSEPGVVWATVDDSSRVQHAMESIADALPQEKFGNLRLDVRIGDPGQLIANLAEELGADMIVVGSHGRTGITRFVLGSVAERVTRLAHCPVLVVKIPLETAGTEPQASELAGAT